jgi:hypothetical protein
MQRQDSNMNRAFFGAAAVALAVGAFSATEADARIGLQAVEASTLVEQAQCAVRRERVVRPNGAVVFRTVRRCGPGPRFGGCKVVRERVERPNGNVVFRTRRVCG